VTSPAYLRPMLDPRTPEILAWVEAMPLTERLIALIADLESGRRAMGWPNVDELVAASRRAA